MYRIIRGCRGGHHRRPIQPDERQLQPKRPRKGLMNSYRISVLFTITVISTHTVAGKCHNWVNNFIKSHSKYNLDPVHAPVCFKLQIFICVQCRGFGLKSDFKTACAPMSMPFMIFARFISYHQDSVPMLCLCSTT